MPHCAICKQNGPGSHLKSGVVPLKSVELHCSETGISEFKHCVCFSCLSQCAKIMSIIPKPCEVTESYYRCEVRHLTGGQSRIMLETSFWTCLVWSGRDPFQPFLKLIVCQNQASEIAESEPCAVAFLFVFIEPKGVCQGIFQTGWWHVKGRTKSL